VRIAIRHSGKLVLHFEFLSLEGRNERVVLADMLHFHDNLPVELLVPPLERSDVAFSRHDNSFQAFRTGLIVTNYSRLVDHPARRFEYQVQNAGRGVNQ
jgi:hypothetical protein